MDEQAVITIHSTLRSAATSYFDIALAVATTYDCALLISSEVEYIWKRPKSIVFGLYLVLRYCGIVVAFNYACIYLPKSRSLKECLQLFETNICGSVIFTLAIEGILMLRVHAMYNRSKRVFIFLIACWLVRIVGAVILTLDALESDDALLVPSDLSHEVLGCQFEFKITGSTTISTMMIPALGFHSILTALVIARYTRDVLELYRLFGQWRVTGLLLVFLRDAFVDFMSILTTAAVNVVIMYIHTKNGANSGVIFAERLLLCGQFILAPRCIIRLRKFYRSQELPTVEEVGEELRFYRRASIDAPPISYP